MAIQIVVPCSFDRDGKIIREEEFKDGEIYIGLILDAKPEFEFWCDPGTKVMLKESDG